MRCLWFPCHSQLKYHAVAHFCRQSDVGSRQGPSLRATRDGWEAIVLAPWPPVSDLQQSGCSTDAGDLHRQGWQSADPDAETGTWSVKHLTFVCERSKFCLHPRGTASQCHRQCPARAPGSCTPARWLLPSSSLKFPPASLFDGGVLASRLLL